MTQDNSFAHDELVKFTMTTLNNLIKNDDILNDLPENFTLGEIKAQLELQHGKSMKIYVMKENGETLPIVVPLNATVSDLKNAIKHYVNLRLKRRGVKKQISWKYVWKNNYLIYQNQKLKDNEKQLQMDYFITNKSKINFIKKLKEKK